MSDERRGVTAREIAARVLARVTAESAFASAALDGEIRRHPQLAASDRGLATELTYGVLRTLGYLDARVAALSTKKRSLEDPRASAELLIGAYSLLFLDKIPAFAAVSEAVSGVRAAQGKHAADYTNAVLRRLADDIAKDGRPSYEDAVWEALPGWLRGALRKSLGRKRAFDFMAASAHVPPLGLAAREDRDVLEARFAGITQRGAVRKSALSPRGLLATSLGDPKSLPGYETDFIVQEEGAQVVALLAGARDDERVLDACSGRGNKAWLLATSPGFTGTTTATDLSPVKLRTLEEGPRATLGIRTHAVDWSVGTGDVTGDFDVALVDAPCSGTGTLRRRPEIALSRSPESVAELAALQLAITRRVASRVRDGGRLVFAVCSVLAEETTLAAAALAAETAFGRRLIPTPFDAKDLPWVDPTASTLLLTPDTQGCDGYFAACFRVVAG